MKIRPLYDRIVVKRIEEKEQMQGGLYIPDTAKEKPQEGEVVAVGKGKRLEDGKVVSLDVQVGDRILFDAKPPRDAAFPGGHGLPFDWRLVAGVAFMLSRTATHSPFTLMTTLPTGLPWVSVPSTRKPRSPPVTTRAGVRVTCAVTADAMSATSANDNNQSDTSLFIGVSCQRP